MNLEVIPENEIRVVYSNVDNHDFIEIDCKDIPHGMARKRQIISALKLQEKVIDEEKRIGHLLVDLQNGWTPEHKKYSEIYRKTLEDMIQESTQQNNADVTNKGVEK